MFAAWSACLTKEEEEEEEEEEESTSLSGAELKLLPVMVQRSAVTNCVVAM